MSTEDQGRPEFDYRRLLAAYMSHVVEQESMHYLDGDGPAGLTAEERAELLAIAREIRADERIADAMRRAEGPWYPREPQQEQG